MIITNHEGNSFMCAITPSNFQFQQAMYDDNIAAYSVPTDFVSCGFVSYVLFYGDAWSLLLFNGEDGIGYDYFDLRWDLTDHNDNRVFEMLMGRWFGIPDKKIEST